MKKIRLNWKLTLIFSVAGVGYMVGPQVWGGWLQTFLTDIIAETSYGLNSAELKLCGDTEHILDVQLLVGFLQAAFNLLALVTLSAAAAWSDGVKARTGRRRIFILVSAVASSLLFPLISFLFHNGKPVAMIIAALFYNCFYNIYRNHNSILLSEYTPKPVRTQANSVINITGYVGYGAGALLGLFFVLSEYINSTARNLWTIEWPFLIGAACLLFSAFYLIGGIDEKRLSVELREEMEEGERQAAVIDKLEEDQPLSRANRRMLIALLATEFLYMMAETACNSYIGNYTIYYLNAASSGSMLIGLINVIFSMLGFVIANWVVKRIGRKFTITVGLAVSAAAFIWMALGCRPTGVLTETGDFALPLLLYFVWGLRGFGMALVYNCVVAMIMELSTGKTVGRFTAFYFGASSVGQILTPITLGILLRFTQRWEIVPNVTAVCFTLSFVIFTAFVKNVKAGSAQAA